jgi:hypothetical protein
LATELFWRKNAVIPEENTTKSKFQMVPVMKKIMPKRINGIMPKAFSESINWGKKDRKNNATLGLSTLVSNPCQ